MKAVYYQDQKRDVVLDVLVDHGNGKADLGRDGEVVVRLVSIESTGKAGTASFLEDPKPAAPSDEVNSDGSAKKSSKK